MNFFACEVELSQISCRTSFHFYSAITIFKLYTSLYVQWQLKPENLILWNWHEIISKRFSYVAVQGLKYIKCNLVLKACNLCISYIERYLCWNILIFQCVFQYFLQNFVSIFSLLYDIYIYCIAFVFVCEWHLCDFVNVFCRSFFLVISLCLFLLITHFLFLYTICKLLSKKSYLFDYRIKYVL